MEPELLLMHEPVAAPHARTRELDGAAFLSYRVVVLGPRADIEVEHPRTLDTKNNPRFTTHVSRIWNALRH